MAVDYWVPLTPFSSDPAFSWEHLQKLSTYFLSFPSEHVPQFIPFPFVCIVPVVFFLGLVLLSVVLTWSVFDLICNSFAFYPSCKRILHFFHYLRPWFMFSGFNPCLSDDNKLSVCKLPACALTHAIINRIGSLTSHTCVPAYIWVTPKHINHSNPK